MKEKTTILCTRLAHGYKLTYSVNYEDIPTIQEMATTKVRDSFADAAKEHISWWIEKCKTHQIKITEVELILPPLLEYMDIEKNLVEFFKKKDVRFFIAIGLKVNEWFDNKSHVWEDGLKAFAKKNTNFN